MSLTQEQAAVVRKYVRDFDGQPRIRIAMLSQVGVGKNCLIVRVRARL